MTPDEPGRKVGALKCVPGVLQPADEEGDDTTANGL